jgi:hypothetical protein
MTMSTGNTSDGTHLHQSTGLTPRTASATDHHYTTNLVDPVACRTSTAAGTSFK